MASDRSPESLHARMARWLRLLRVEEKVLLGTWAFGLGLCVWSGTDSQSYGPVFKQYLYFFGRYLVYLFVATRILLWVDDTWTPAHPVLLRIKAWFYGAQHGYEPDRYDRVLVRTAQLPGQRASVLGVDLEFLRLGILLFANLTVYSNIKTHIPFINSARGDDAFIAMDYALFGEGFIHRIEAWFREDAGVADYFAHVYMHDYMWMVVLMFLLYVRRDLFAMRWTVMSVCFVYILGILTTVAYPSYGPCFLEPERFEWLRGTVVGRAQGGLAQFFKRSTAAIANDGSFDARAFVGIAAFPSLHVGHMVIMLVVALRTIPIYALWMTWVTVLTFIATIGFGWHYAVDGIGGIALAVGVTEATYRLMRRWDRAAVARAEAATR